MSTHLLCCKGHFYYRIKIPVDLKQHFPSVVFKQSLKTNNFTTAKMLLVSMEYKVQKTFALLRSGMLTEDVVQGMVAELYPGRKVVQQEAVRLADLMAEYERANTDKWTHKTKIEIAGCHRLILDVMGNVEVKGIVKQDVLNFKDVLQKLPANIYKIYKDKSVKDVLLLTDIVPMSVKSMNKHILRLNALLNYAVKESIVSANYAQGMMIPEKRRSDEERKAYSNDDVKNIVEYLFVDKEKPERYWIVLIAMYSGLRLDEICQLYVEDVQQIDGVWCISVNDEKDKKVKTSSGKRVVPVHPVLLSCRLIEYVEGLKAAGVPRLWMNLKWREADGYSNAFGKWYQRFNRDHVTNDQQKTFHSLRHLVANTLKQAGVQEIVIAEIMGHVNSSMTTGRYGKRYQPKVLLDALVKLDYGVEVPKW